MAQYDNSSNMAYDLVIKMFQDRMSELKMSQYKLAKITGISAPTLMRYFNKSSEMTFKNQLKICGALQINPYWIPKELDDNQMEYLNFN